MGDRTAHALSARLDELASVAERSGAAGHAVARLLEAASVAAMNALALELLIDRAPGTAGAAPAEPAPAAAVQLRDAA
jgi:hypothetical protein